MAKYNLVYSYVTLNYNVNRVIQLDILDDKIYDSVSRL